MKVIKKKVEAEKIVFTTREFFYDYYDMESVLDDLLNTTLGFPPGVLIEEKLEKFLLEKDVIVKSIRGGCYRGDKYDEFVEKFHKLELE